jgi:hypothetical protein
MMVVFYLFKCHNQCLKIRLPIPTEGKKHTIKGFNQKRNNELTNQQVILESRSIMSPPISVKVAEVDKQPVAFDSQVVGYKMGKAFREVFGLAFGQPNASKINKHQRIMRAREDHVLIIQAAGHDIFFRLAQIPCHQGGQIHQDLFFLVLAELFIGFQFNIGHNYNFGCNINKPFLAGISI